MSFNSCLRTGGGSCVWLLSILAGLFRVLATGTYYVGVWGRAGQRSDRYPAPSWRRFRLDGTERAPLAGERFAASLQTIPGFVTQLGPRLHRLVLNGYRAATFEDTAAFEHGSPFLVLDFAEARNSHFIVKSLLEAQAPVTEIDLADLPRGYVASLMALLQRPRAIRYFYIGEYDLTDAELDAIVRYVTDDHEVSYFHLARAFGSGMTFGHASTISRTFRSSSLTFLGIQGCGVEDANLAPILVELGSSTVATLDLSDNRIGPPGAAALAGALAASKVTTLWLSRNPLQHNGVASLAESLTSTTSLRWLHLPGVGISTAGAVAFAEALRGGSALAGLYLQSNELRDAAAVALADALADDCPLQDLDLEDNLIGDEGAAALAAALTTNSNLARLWLSGNEIGPAGMSSLAAVPRQDLEVFVDTD